MYLSPCLIAVIIIIAYILIGRQNQMKIKTFVNKNQKSIIAIAVIGGVFYFMNNDLIEGVDDGDEDGNEEATGGSEEEATGGEETCDDVRKQLADLQEENEEYLFCF